MQLRSASVVVVGLVRGEGKGSASRRVARWFAGVWLAGKACCGAERPDGLMVVGGDPGGCGMSALRWAEV